MNLLCPSCNNKEVSCIGEIPTMNIFAGRTLSKPLPLSNLFKCVNCNLQFRWPRLSKNELDELYKNGSVKNWQNSLKERKDWQLAIDEVKGNGIIEGVLDIGCFNGSFLSYLKGFTNLYGVEINPDAIIRAKENGINIISTDFVGLASLEMTFDVITAFDVIEHTEKPFSFLESIVKKTNENGRIILSTGNTDARTWKIGKNKYWYCSIPEHISFINDSWCHFSANQLGLEIECLEKISHAGKVGLMDRLIDWIKNFLYLLAPRCFGLIRKFKHWVDKKETSDMVYYPPSWMTSKDHIFIVFRKKSL